MFERSFRSQDRSRIEKAAARLVKKSNSTKDPHRLAKLQRSFADEARAAQPGAAATLSSSSSPVGGNGKSKSNKSLAPSPIVTLMVGREGRLFAAHEDVLRQAPFFDAACRDRHFVDAQSKRISLPDEEPEVFSAVLEYLYKGDYYPRLVHNRQRNSWEVEDAPVSRGTPYASSSPYSPPYVDNNPYPNGGGRAAASPRGPSAPTTAPDATLYVAACGQDILRDTAVYCAADRYGLEELKKVALRKQGLQAGIDVGTILRSAQYAYAHTPDTDSRLRAHYLALIIRCRKTFKRSGTMQAEMERGGSKLFFDLFVAMCNHLDDVIDVSNARSPKTI
ncbi:hypothetical protein SODALDRAFT_204800 [Sodiomyces alkalinus F11]|uniref:BTB domain-containing protein n=1 Tax=Sodiomyces alkalinus (strain CBS 110278 / VKM F-3762 / F11) TaxID=1314773 RepID=A0A3N2PQD3_SODAK|nr:hypothetical protein SODALDRAFT_204800 [Sodiomyces alkalinus F11]ROT36674.1 hypothetical protein SODALDRAFT_204800 [Sodiomyces alkalinus F11]